MKRVVLRQGTEIAVVFGCVLLGCGQRQALVRSEAPATVVGVSSSDVLGPYVPAGTELTVTLDTKLSATGSVTGEPFTATADSTAMGTDGHPLVVPGAPIHGHVASVASGDRPQIVLVFDTVQTRLGLSPMVATVLDVQEARTPTAVVEQQLLSSPATTRPPEGVPITTRFTSENDVVLPEGTRLRLELTRSLFPPGTIVGH
jgi:hypothetical protein